MTDAQAFAEFSSRSAAGLAEKYVALWKTLDPDPTVDEVIRNYPVRQPLLWIR